MILILAEKPSQARNFAKALSGMTGDFEGEAYVIGNARGHLYEFEKIDKQVASGKVDRYSSWNLENLPWDERDIQWKYGLRKDASSFISALKKQAKGCDEICIATDDDPTGEGQLLAIEILLETGIHVGKKVTRMYFVDESEKEVRKAFKNRKVIPDVAKDPEYRKALFRSKWDYLSMQFTRVATKCGDGQTMLRQGRLKSAMVHLVGDQLDKIAAYKEIPFFSNKFRDENGIVYTNPDEPTYPSEDQVPKIYTDSPVKVDSKTMKKSAPPRLIDLAGLSGRLASKGIGAKTVLKTYQAMYEAQIVSYPRTEDKQITPEQFNEMLPLVDKIAKLVGVDPSILTHRVPRKTHVKTGCAHGANRPGLKVPSSLQDLTKYGPGAIEIYTMLAKSFLCMFAEDYEYEHQKGYVEKYPDFVGTANVPVKQGWKAVDGDADMDDEEASAKGLGTHAEPFVHRGVPPKPTYPTMRWLMKQLEMRDVGTGATRTSIYADVTNPRIPGYLLEERKGKISMTKAGQMSHRLLPGTHIGDLSLTESLMADMRAIEAGEKDPDACLAAVKQMVVEDIETMRRNGQSMRKDLGIVEYQEKEKFQGTWNGKVVSFNRVFGGHRFTDDECARLCKGEQITIEITTKSGGTAKMTGGLADQTYNGHDFVGFKGAFDPVPGSWCGHTFTDEERRILKSGGSVYVKGLKSKAGKVFDAELTLVPDDKGGQRIGFSDDVPREWCKHEFTEKERETLRNGGTVFVEGAISRKGNTFDVEVRYGEDEDGKKKIIPLFNK